MKEKAIPLVLKIFEIPQIMFIKYMIHIIYKINNTLKLHMYNIQYTLYIL